MLTFAAAAAASALRGGGRGGRGGGSGSGAGAARQADADLVGRRGRGGGRGGWRRQRGRWGAWHATRRRRAAGTLHARCGGIYTVLPDPNSINVLIPSLSKPYTYRSETHYLDCIKRAPSLDAFKWHIEAYQFLSISDYIFFIFFY